jgi:hypothetical protein
LEGALF